MQLLVVLQVMQVKVLLLGQEVTLWLDWGWVRRSAEILLVCGAGVAAYIIVHLASGTRMRHLRAPAHTQGQNVRSRR